MKLTRKIQKLFSSDGIVSAWEHTQRWMHPVKATNVVRNLEALPFERIHERAPYRPDPQRIRTFLKISQDLWLDRMAQSDILDLGCGAGYFLYICKLFGHKGIGLDIDEEPLYRETLPLLGVNRVIFRIQAQVSLPDLGQRFDLVTATRVCFHVKGWPPYVYEQEWTLEDWRFFINDVRSRFLKPDGRLFLKFNPRPNGSPFFTPELRAHFLAEGGRVSRSKALFATDPTRRPRFKQTKRMIS